MLFSSISFLYYFLPILLLIYFLAPKKFRNFILLIASLVFYFYGEPKYIWILLLSCFMNYIFGLLIEKEKHQKLLLWIAILCNLGLLCYFKYIDFIITNVNQLFHLKLNLFHVVMPIGISFFTFQTLSYVIDVYDHKVKANHNFFDFATYVCLFPQLVAGPIVRYSTIHEELKKRTHSISDFASGVTRFCIGLSKKVLLANEIGLFCNSILDMNQQSVLGYWFVAVGFTLQIYFDFSGYSDMAIGLGRMFGFHFLENFNYPLIAKSVTDFWRRWHISLSSWFRDYVYIPLGGNRVSKIQWIRNILIVWLCTGIWHGAAWNFILWGLFFAIFLILEKKLFGKFLEHHKVFGHIYTVIIILISFVIFNAGSMTEIKTFLLGMFGMNRLPIIETETLYYIRSGIVLFIIGIIGATPLFVKIIQKLKQKKGLRKIIDGLEPCYNLLLLVLVTAFLVDSSFNPFLYFRF